jgi:uncharacterized protein YcbX
MTVATLRHIFRHPIKGIGSEVLDRAELSPDGALHGDRAWALLTAGAPDVDDWQPRRNFLVVASGPNLAPVTAKTQGKAVTLRHPDRPDLTLNPDTDGAALNAWVAPLWPEDRPAPARLVKAPGHGMTDMETPYVSLGNLASLRAFSQRAGAELDMRRFRINLWVDGLAPWEEFDLIGKSVALGDLTLEAAEPIGRCRAPEASPAKGVRDMATNKILQEAYGHTDFGIYLRVATPGTVQVGDTFMAA